MKSSVAECTAIVMFSTILPAFLVIFTVDCGLAGRALSPSNSLDYQGHEGPLHGATVLYSSNSSNNASAKCEHPWKNHTGAGHGNVSYISSCQFVLDYCGDIAALADYLRFIVCYFPSYKVAVLVGVARMGVANLEITCVAVVYLFSTDTVASISHLTFGDDSMINSISVLPIVTEVYDSG